MQTRPRKPGIRKEKGEQVKQLEEIKARLEAATPGPWSVSLNNKRTANLLLIHSGTELEDRLGKIYEDDDAFFIAHAPTDQARLIAALEAVALEHAEEVLAVHEGYGKESWCPRCREHYPCPTITAITEALA